MVFGDVTETAFSSYLRFAAMFEQAELRGIQMGPNGPPNAKKPLKSPQKSIFQKTGPFGDVTETAILAILASHFRGRVDTPKKNPTWGLA